MAKTFAQQAKTITNKYKLRLGDNFDKGDPLALAAMNAELTELQEQQESVRQLEFEAENADKIGAIQQFANGGKLSKKQQTTLSDILNESLPEYHAGGGLPHDHSLEGGIDLGTDPNQYSWGGTDIPPVQQGLIPGQQTSPADPARAGQLFDRPEGGDGAFKSRVPWMGAAASAVGNILANRPIDLPEYEYEEYRPEKATANLVDYSRGREQTIRERDQANAIIARGARGTGSQAGLMENILAGTTGTQRAAGEAFNKSLEQEANINAQIRNRVSEFNAAQAGRAGEMNMRNKLYATQLGRESTLIEDRRRQDRIYGITDAAQGYAKDRMTAQRDDQMINLELARNPNFGLKQQDPTFWRRMAGITDPIEELTFKNTKDII